MFESNLHYAYASTYLQICQMHWGEKTTMASNCETCMNYEYDEEYEYYVCTKNLDEDEMYRFIKGDFKECPYYQFGDEYQIVRKQM